MKTTLEQVYRKAYKDPMFLNALIRNPERALAIRRMSLSSADLKKLKSLVRTKFKITGKKVLRVIAYCKSTKPGGDPPPPPWPKEVCPLESIRRGRRRS
jgi:hypothetical protein